MAKPEIKEKIKTEEEIIKEKPESSKRKKSKKKEKVNPIAGFEGKTIDLKVFDQKDSKEQSKEVEDTLKDIYKDNLKVNRKHIIKVIKLTLNPKDSYIYLPYNLKIAKNGLDLVFSVEKKKEVPFGWVIFAIWAFVFALIAATYAGVKYLSLAELNKDIDGDGIPDINIDINNDNIAEINIANKGEIIPILNIDYKGNRKAVFNIDTNGDGIADSNLVTIVTDKNTKCTINCDTNGDGWPDLNLDLDGDGKPDVDIDTDGDGVADLNIDLNGSGLCDVMCDTDGDGKCDINCIKATDPGKQNGSSTSTGDPETIQGTATIVINFIAGETINIDNLVPDDQPTYPGEVRIQPSKSFSVENTGSYAVMYSLKWKNVKNTFTSSNFKFMMEGTNGAPNLGYAVAPYNNDYIVRNVIIQPRVTQNYKITFNLEGVGGPQNYDQNKHFEAMVDIEL